jgi:cation diffusion facilitator CzcD-associated flavoprotein CzcO
MSGEAKTIAVLGAGVAGLAVAKTLKQYGFDVTVYEARSALGGVWANNYRSLCVLEPKWVYGYPDWPWPRDTPLYPPASHVRSYLEAYTQQFGIQDRIHLNTRVIEAVPTGDRRWRIVAESDGERDTAEYDYFVIAPGMFNLKKVPDWPGKETFEGELIHSSEFREGAQIEDKHVVIVGFSRSAMDIAVDIVDTAASVTVLHRSIRWPVPEKILGLIRNQPDRPIKLDLFTNLYIAPPRFFGLVGDGTIGSRHAQIESFEKDRVRLNNGEFLPADLVLCATGWYHDYSFLPPELLEKIYDADGMHLYRHMLHPDIPGFAFVGGVQGINSATLYAMQATWLARYLKGEFDLPPAAGQLAEIDALKVWNRTFVTERPNRSHILNLHQLPYIDDLMDDMGLEKRRKPFIADQFVPYRSVDYAAVTAGTNPH